VGRDPPAPAARDDARSSVRNARRARPARAVGELDPAGLESRGAAPARGRGRRLLDRTRPPRGPAVRRGRDARRRSRSGLDPRAAGEGADARLLRRRVRPLPPVRALPARRGSHRDELPLRPAARRDVSSPRTRTTCGSGYPDSIVVADPGRGTLLRSRAALSSLERLGGLWRALAIAASLVPCSCATRSTDAVAAVRKKVFAKPDDVCPIVPAYLARRFDP
jgi:hypothetical protein